jgi:hypothetical protein
LPNLSYRLSDRQKRLAERANRVIASNPTHFDVAKVFLKRGITLPEAVESMRRCYAVAALVESHFNITRAARASGMHRNSFARIVIPEIPGMPPASTPVLKPSARWWSASKGHALHHPLNPKLLPRPRVRVSVVSLDLGRHG